jgi:hypothetical protein
VCESIERQNIYGDLFRGSKSLSFIFFFLLIAGLLQVDIYLCPKSTSFLTKDSRKVFGEIDLPQGELGYNPKKVVVDKAYRIDFVIGFTFTSIKYLVRKKPDALDGLFREYEYLSERYGIKVDPLISKENNFETLRQIITNLKKAANEKQSKALSEIEEFSFKVEATENHEHIF